MSIYLPAESTGRIQVAVAETTRRQRERQAIRKQLARARRAGLAHRHRTKLTERNSAMVLKTDNAPAKTTRRKATVPDSSPPVPGAAEELVQASFPEVDAALPIVDFEEHFRLADNQLQNVTRHLRKLRHIPAARDALRLVREAQNKLQEAEDS